MQESWFEKDKHCQTVNITSYDRRVIDREYLKLFVTKIDSCRFDFWPVAWLVVNMQQKLVFSKRETMNLEDPARGLLLGMNSAYF